MSRNIIFMKILSLIERHTDNMEEEEDHHDHNHYYYYYS